MGGVAPWARLPPIVSLNGHLGTGLRAVTAPGTPVSRRVPRPLPTWPGTGRLALGRLRSNRSDKSSDEAGVKGIPSCVCGWWVVRCVPPRARDGGGVAARMREVSSPLSSFTALR